MSTLVFVVVDVIVVVAVLLLLLVVAGVGCCCCYCYFEITVGYRSSGQLTIRRTRLSKQYTCSKKVHLRKYNYILSPTRNFCVKLCCANRCHNVWQFTRLQMNADCSKPAVQIVTTYMHCTWCTPTVIQYFVHYPTYLQFTQNFKGLL